MSAFVLPVLFTLFVWWFSTGAILYLTGLARWTFKWSMAGATALLIAALWGLAATRNLTTVAGAYCAFSCAVLVWAWQEVAFLLGYVTGPRRVPAATGARGLRLAWQALQTLLHHEAALIVLAAAVWLCAGTGSNAVGWWTYLILWTMRASAKLNVFLGVRNLNEDFLPAHLKYLQTYFVHRPMNLLFPFAMSASTAVATVLWAAAAADGASAFTVAGLTFAAGLLSLAVLEHWFLVLPLPAEALWRWGLSSREPAALSTELQALPAQPVPVPPLRH